MKIKIKRMVDGKEIEFQLTEEEIEEVRRQDKIQWARDVLALYSDSVAYYDAVIGNDDQMLQFAELLEKKSLTDNGELEIEAIKELFGILGEGEGAILTSLDEELLDIINTKGIIPAIKRYREEARVGLRESKEYCEALKNKALRLESETDSPFVRELKDYIKKDNVIMAIKLYREKMGVSLLDAKEYCFNLRREMGYLS